MRSPLYPVLLISLSLFLFCGEKDKEQEGRTIMGEVKSVQTAGRYMFFQMSDKDEEIWVAASPVELETGDWVQFPATETFKNFKSEQLGRTFDEIYFAPVLKIQRRGSHTAVGPSLAGKAAEPVARAPGGYTVAEIHAQKAALNGQVVSVSGKVVKFNPGILGKNWIHIQDGTGEKDTTDLTIAALPEAMAPVGTKITVTGKLALDRDLGAGYLYKVLIEEAQVKVQ